MRQFDGPFLKMNACSVCSTGSPLFSSGNATAIAKASSTLEGCK
jgi:hypothetical protein